MIRTIIFDFDGTIADTLPIVIKNAGKLCKALGLKQIKYTPKIRDKSLRDFRRKELKISIFKQMAYVRKLRKLLAPELKEAKVFEGIKQTIDRLSEQFRIGILTSNSKEIVEKVLQDNKISTIDFISSESSIFGKHRRLRKVLRKQRLRKNEVIYVGDEVRDIEASKKAGIRIIAVSYGFNSEKALLENAPDGLAETPKEIIKAVQEMNKS